MNYLTRPIFQFAINWSDPVTKRFQYDLKEMTIGFGAEFFTSLGNFVVQGYEFTLDLRTDAEIDAMDAFTAAVFGRLVGFWLPAPIEGMQITAAVDTTHFDIVAQGLADTWNLRPDLHLYFSRAGYSPAAAKITNVVSNGATERVTIDTAVNINLLNSAASVSRLVYVRLADDTERAKFMAEGWQKRPVRVIELPNEYTAFEMGERPIYLYHFWCDVPIDVHWYYTSFAADVISRNVTYKKFAIDNSTFAQSTKGDAEKLEINAKYDADHPFALFLPIPFARPLNVEVLEIDYTAPEVRTVRFTGTVRTVDDEGDRVVAHCDSLIHVLSRKCPVHLIQADCSYLLYDQKTCKVQRYEFETMATLYSMAAVNGVAAPQVAVTLLFPTDDRKIGDYFAHGWLETGQGTNYEVRMILASSYNNGTGKLTLSLNAPLYKAVVGQNIQLVPGCDGSKETCANKFKNFPKNFGGFPFVPERNPTIAAVQGNVSAGGKK